MARQQSDREDLLAEAKTLVRRVEIFIQCVSEPVVIGFRRDCSCSVYFGADPVLQFNSQKELRRAYIDGELYKAEDGRLARIRRESNSGRLHLVSEALERDAEAALVDLAAAQVDRLVRALEQGGYHEVGRVPDDADVVSEARTFLASLPDPWRIALRPNAS